ncbi:MAG: DeoR/GlpR transcriptional regulator [Clostridia bacterium]|nr:DeoR/GlpR transcriptional regulator [Clostridia bacterium]
MSESRRARIREMLNSQPYVSLKQLEAEFPSYSSMTLRRDLEYFEKIGEVIRVRGGARSVKHLSHAQEEVYSRREAENPAAKKSIALQAIRLIEPGRSYFFDSGTSIMNLARILPDERLFVITSGPNIALEIIKKQHPTVSVVGGVLNRDNISLSGNASLHFLDSLNIDIAFIAPTGFSQETGFTCGNSAEAELKKYIMAKARTVVVLMDASKFDRSLPYTFGRSEDVDILLTDRMPIPATAEKLRAGGVEIVVCDKLI